MKILKIGSMAKTTGLALATLVSLASSICEICASAPFLDSTLKGSKKVILINPAGHAGDTGRNLQNGFERAATFRFSQELQGNLEKNNDCRVVLTRVPGEKIVDFQNASFANRLNVDLFISIHLFKHDSIKPKVYVYQHVSDPVADFVSRSFPSLKFVPVLQAHQVNIFRTKQIGHMVSNFFSNSDNQKMFDFGGFYGIPLKPLCGVVAPAILLEVGVNQDDDWMSILDAAVQVIGRLV